jgi:hypothetical protein
MPENNPETAAQLPENQSTEQLLGNIATAAAKLEEAKQDFVMSVALARRESISWAAIGKTLGVTRQAVWYRFADAVTDYDTE